MSRPRPPPAPVIAADRCECLDANDIRRLVRHERIPAGPEGRTRSHHTGQQLDREPSPSFQRAVRCIEGGDGGFRDRLPGGVETLWNRGRGGAGRQYENRGPSENGRGARTDRSRDDFSTARSVRTDIRDVRDSSQRHAEQRGLNSAAAARKVIELAEQTPAPSRAPVGPDAEKMLQLVREKSDPELDALRLQLVGLS